MALRYRIPLPGPFYYSGRVGPKHWLLRSSHNGFVPAWRERVAVEGRSFGLGSVRVSCPPRLFRRAGIVSSVS